MSGERFSRGGYIPGPTVTVKARVVGGRTEYWEQLIGAWVPVITANDMRESQARSQQADRNGPDRERADSYEREDHG